MIKAGDMVTVRTSVTKRRTKAKAIYVNYKYAWFTGEVRTPTGKTYCEAFWIRDVDLKMEEEGRKTPTGKRWWEEEDRSDNWLSEWDDDRFDGKKGL